MSTAELKELVESLVLAQRETDRLQKETASQMKATDRQMKETDRQIKELGRQIGGLGNKFGSFTEGLSFRSLSRILRERFGMISILGPARIARDGVSEEYDLLAHSSDEDRKGMIVEIKSKLRGEDIDQMKRKMGRLFEMLPSDKDRTFEGMIACVSGTDDLKRQVLKNGWHLAHIGDDLFELETPPGFVAKVYRA